MSAVQQIVDRLIADPDYRIAVAVANNPSAVMVAYNLYYNGSETLDTAQLTRRLQLLFSVNRELAEQILNVEWNRGNGVLDEAYDQLKAEAEAEPEATEAIAKSTDGGAWSFGMDFGGVLTGIANIAGLFGSGQRAREAAQAETNRLALAAQAQAEADARKAERLRMMLKALGIGAAVVGAIVVLVLLFRKPAA